MKKHKMTSNLAAVAASTLALTGMSANAATVYNVDFGTSITTDDNYIGAATENTVNSTWNHVTGANLASSTLADSTGDSSAGVTMTVSGEGGNMPGHSQNNQSGDDIFDVVIKGGSNSFDFTVNFGNLDPGATYDLVYYADWYWAENGSTVPVSQTAGSGLTGTFNINISFDGRGADGVGPLLEDTDAANVGTANANYARFNGLTPDAGGNIAILTDGGNFPTSGFQLVQVPEPSSTALLGLGGLALILRRRK
jgi:hypothetical protein